MALTTVGSLVVKIDTSSTTQLQMDTFKTLKECAADYVGGRPKSSVLEMAGRGILAGIDYMNADRLFDFATMQLADQTLVEDQMTYSLPSDFFAVREVQLIDTNSKVFSRLDYQRWGSLNQSEPKQTRTGTPDTWTSRDTFTEGQIIIYPAPSATAAADYKLRVTYYTRIERPSADSDVIAAPRELGQALCWYAKFFLASNKEDDGAASRKAQAAWQYFKDWERMFSNSRRREPAQRFQTTIPKKYRNRDWYGS